MSQIQAKIEDTDNREKITHYVVQHFAGWHIKRITRYQFGHSYIAVVISDGEQEHDLLFFVDTNGPRPVPAVYRFVSDAESL